MNTNEAFKALYDTVVRLRGPDGCPWDREQTPSSLRGALIEETYECIEAIDENNSEHIAEELGDLYLVATMIAYMHEQKGTFSVTDVFNHITDKLIRRHPHVFGDVKVKDSAEVLDNWEAIKAGQEGRKTKEFLMDEVSVGLPPMDRAFKLQKIAAKAGFDWPNVKGVVAKIREEFEEMQRAVDDIASTDPENVSAEIHIEEELGDILFTVINMCRYLSIEPSTALRKANTKFAGRFKYIEQKMKETGQEMKKENLNIMDSFWKEAKKI
jgi:tetrapyrrole methylase family protein/MazG family protein